MAITASIIGATFVTVMMNGETHTINGDHANYSAIREALKAKDHALVEQLINIKKTLINFVQGTVRIMGDQVFYGDMEVKGSVVNRILQMVREGFDAQPMLKFLGNLMLNPSKRAVDELYGFLEATSLPITEDGHFLAYKKVRDDYKDFYTGKMDNSIGQVLEMPRNQVDDNRDQTCSHGLHFCSLSYLPHYHGGTGRVMIVKINPADVVSIPSDYNNAKGRAARYEIVGEYEGEDRERQDYFTSPVYAATVNNVAPAAKPSPIGENDEDAYDRGYEAGKAAAEFDSENLRKHDTDASQDESSSYLEGYEAGYEDNHYIDWESVGYDTAESDVDDGNSYNDSPPSECDDDSLYREGYANGWRDAKIARI